MDGMQGETQGTSLLSGEARRELGASGVRPSVVEALDTDLDAYLDRELFTRTDSPGSIPAPAPEPVSAPEQREESAPGVPGRAPSVLELAEEETEWLSQLPPPAAKVEVAPVEPLPAPLAPVAPPPVYSWSAPAVAPVQAPRDGSRRVVWLAAGALAGVAVVGALAAGMLWTGLQLGEAKASRVASVPVVAAPVATGVEAPVVSPAPVVAPPPVSPAPASVAEAAPVQESPGPAQGEQGSRADGVEPQQAPVVPATAVAAVEPREEAPAARPVTEPKQGRVKPARVVSAEPAEVLPVSATVSEEPAPEPEEAEAEPKKAKSGYEEFDEEYARELGFTDKPATESASPRKIQNVYIPPAPGESLPERLTSADIMKVVVGNKMSIAGCIQEHRARTQPGAKGQFVARWSVLPDGSTVGATVETAEFSGTPLAQCIEGLVKGWKFPRHRVAQQEPIRFPFTF